MGVGFWYGSGLSSDVFLTATCRFHFFLHCMVYVGESDLWLKGRVCGSVYGLSARG